MRISGILINLWPKRWVATALVLLFIFYLTLVPRPLPDTNIEIPGLDKLVHAIMFGVLAFVASIDMARRNRSHIKSLSISTIIIISVIVAFIGLLIEILQQLMQLGRVGDLLDFIADIIGIIIASIITVNFLNSLINRPLDSVKTDNTKTDI